MITVWLLTAVPLFAATAKRTGWHGETLPEGLERAEAEGDYLWGKDQAVMVYIPAGSFPMGSEKGSRDEKPVHEVHLDAYYIDKYEVSWGQWKASKLPYSDSIQSRDPLPKPPDWGIIDNHPMLNVTWKDAKNYSSWAGKSLPTEAQWEKAARGTDGREFPWGDQDPTFDHAIWRHHPMGQTSTGTVDCCAAGASPYGVFNMAGNIYEWCEDVYDKTFYARSPKRNPVNLEPPTKGDAPGIYRVLRGGALVLEVEDMRSAYRYRLLEKDRTPYIGFRTVLNIP
ncbi:MAG: formylglycine-generating enzyme family protein [Deltaproteobacteria bacterium]|nr:formylglycine-generating enzyme family protein [Deltaproteobacteria bacterium]